MADQSKHIDQWRHNRALLAVIPTSHPDWIVTVAFYVALHAVEALLAHDNVGRINSHDSRNNVLMQIRRYQQIWKHYQPLHDLSRRIRYLAEPSIWVPSDQIAAQVFGRYLYPLERSVQKLTGQSLDLPNITLAV